MKRQRDDNRNELIRHHLEEAATHLRAAELKMRDGERPFHETKFRAVGKFIKGQYIRYGGIPHD